MVNEKSDDENKTFLEKLILPRVKENDLTENDFHILHGGLGWFASL